MCWAMVASVPVAEINHKDLPLIRGARTDPILVHQTNKISLSE